MTFFHLTGAPLESGSVIRPGNWGRVVKLSGWLHPSAMREMALEDARLTRWPERPSRLRCAFVCITELEARLYQAASVRFHVLHEVDLVDPNAVPFETSWELVKPENTGPMRNDWCDAYWSGEAWKSVVGLPGTPFEGVTAREGLTTSALRVVKALD